MPNSVVNLDKSFHDGMKAYLSINGELLEEKTDVDNGLRQGCTMPPTLFIREFGSTLCRDGTGCFVFPIHWYRSENPKYAENRRKKAT